MAQSGSNVSSPRESSRKLPEIFISEPTPETPTRPSPWNSVKAPRRSVDDLGVSYEANPYRAIIASADPRAMTMLESLAGGHHAWTVVNSCPNAVFALDAATRYEPDLVLMTDEMPGLSGADAVPELHRLVPKTEVILIALGHSTDHLRRDARVFDAVSIHRSGRVVQALDALAHFLDHPADGRPERRNRDRRQIQDWSKVWRERRSELRRSSDLREAG